MSATTMSGVLAWLDAVDPWDEIFDEDWFLVECE